MNVSKDELIKWINEYFFKDFNGNLQEYLLDKGIIGSDDIYADTPVTKVDFARILHLLLKNEFFLPDIEDISRAYVLRDIFDCHVCVNHIAQVYLRNVIISEKIDNVEIFNGKRKITISDVEESLKAVADITEVLTNE